MTGQRGQDCLERIDSLLFGGTDVRHDIQIVLSTGFASETSGNLAFDFDHANIPLRLIIVKRNGKVQYEAADGILVISKTVDQSQKLTSFRFSPLPGFPDRFRIFLIG